MATAATAHVIDLKAMAAGIGLVKTGKGYCRIVAGGATLAYVKPGGTVTVPAKLVARAPKKLGSFSVESNGRWAGVRVRDTAAGRAILEYVAAQCAEKTSKS